MAVSFSYGQTADAAISSISASPSGYVSIRYMSSWSQVYPDVVETLNNGYNVTYNFPLQFGYTFADMAKDTWATGTIYVKVNFTVSYNNGDTNFENERFIGSSFSGNNYSVSYYPIDNTSGYVIAVFDHFKVTNNELGGPTDWKISASRFTDAYTLGAMALLASNAGNTITTDYTNNLADQIASGINSSSDIDLIIAHLSSIASNTELLSQVLSKLDNLNTVMANIYSRLGSTNQAIERLTSALAGVDSSTLSSTQLQKAMFDNWVKIIQTAMDNNAPDTSKMESARSDQQQQLQQNESLEQVAYDFNDSAMKDLDFNVQIPTSIAGAAVQVMALLSQLWGKLGDLQFLVTAACTTGIITIVLGVVNRFVRADYYRSQRKAGGRASRSSSEAKR